jgi:hypothetical protein
MKVYDRRLPKPWFPLAKMVSDIFLFIRNDLDGVLALWRPAIETAYTHYRFALTKEDANALHDGLYKVPEEDSSPPTS